MTVRDSADVGSLLLVSDDERHLTIINRDAELSMSTNPLTDFEEKIGYRFRDIRLLTEAITHSTYAYEHADKGVRNNERLNFKDSVLGLTVSYLLMQEGGSLKGACHKSEPGLFEETCTKRQRIRVTTALGKGEELTGGRQKASNLADALEAVFARSV